LLGNENNTQVISSLKLKNVSSPYQPVGSYAQTDFDLQEGSPLIDSGQPLTHTTSSGAGTTVPVRNARVFSDGFGIISGDMIVVGTHKGAQVTGVDVSANTIKVDRSVSWGSQDPVTLTYSGNAPDIGAREYLQATIPTPTTAIPTPTTAVPTPIDNKPGVCLSGYRDVPKTYTFQEHIQNLTCDGVVGGYEDKTFRPDTSVTRAEMAKFITNAFQLPTNTTCQPFSDVPSNHTFYPVIMSLKCNGVSSGYEDGTYKPDEPIRRGEAMKFVVRGARIGADNSSLFSYNGSDIRFADVPSDYTFYEVIMGASNQQVISGFESGLFEPDAFITRGAMAKIVDNARTTAGVSEQ
jgi:hypothetical protein